MIAVAMDPATRQVMEAMDQVFPALGTEVTDAVEARRILAEAPAIPAASRPLPRVEERHVPGPAGAPDVRVRIYWPVENPADLPVVVYFHGGGWVLCDLDTHDATCRALALGVEAVVVSVDYRLAPEYRFPAATEDAYAVTCWVAENAGELGVDPARLAVAGDSAGGNLAAATCLMARDRSGPSIAFQLLVYPAVDQAADGAYPSRLENAEGYFLTATHMQWYSEQYIAQADRVHPYASPIRAESLAGLPPAFVATAGYDPLRDEGEAYGKALQQAGVPVAVRRYEGMFHGFFQLPDLLDGARQGIEEASAALREGLAESG